MTEAEIIRLIRDTVRNEIKAVLLGKVTENASQTRTSIQHFPSSTPIGNLRNMQPFGVSSRAPVGTTALVMPINGDSTHLVAAAHFDENRPVGADGETIIYDAFGHKIHLSQSKIQIGSDGAGEPAVLGLELKALLSSLLDSIANHQHIGNMGILTPPPVNAADFESLKSSPVGDNGILSDKIFVEK